MIFEGVKIKILIMYKHGNIEGETRERIVQKRRVSGSVRCMMKERRISMEVDK